MKLVRFVMLELGPNARAWEKFRMQRGPVTLGTLRDFGNNEGLRLFLAADLMLARYPERNSDLEVIVPEAERKRLEEALETAANLIAVATGERRRVTSPTPCVVFEPQDDDERAWLEESAGIAPTETQRAFVGGAYDLELTEDVIGALEDRLDGVALLAEALAHAHGTGTFHELLRVFERAFARSSTALIEPLAGFLAKSPLNHTRDEVEEWCVGLRHSATHADKRPEFVLERDILPVSNRMMAAAYDVLLNKAEWRTPSGDRRQIWTPAFGSAGYGTGDLFITRGEKAVITAQILDDYGVYPLDLDAFLGDLPEHYWPRSVGVAADGEAA